MLLKLLIFGIKRWLKVISYKVNFPFKLYSITIFLGDSVAVLDNKLIEYLHFHEATAVLKKASTVKED